MSKNTFKLVDQAQALDSFFESLMRDVAAYEESEQDEKEQQLSSRDINTLQAAEPTLVDAGNEERLDDQIELPTPAVERKLEPVEAEATKPVMEEQSSTNLFDVLPPVAPATITPTPALAPAVAVPQAPEETSEISESEVEIASDAEQEIEPAPEKPALGKPEWAESDFQAMLFKVAGLSLAVPLVELNGIVECDLSEVTAMPGHADFYLGLMSHLDKTVPLVDTARFVLPPDKLQILTADKPEERITRVVMISDCQYGLACDEVNEVVTLSPDAVRWRTQRTSRRWLAGTVIEHMCALIDANAFAELLARQAPIQEFRH